MTLFLSYSSRDGDAVRTLVRALEASGRSVWLDQDLVGGEAWWNAILAQIRACDVFVYAVSENSLDSDPCTAEYDYARALGLPILPVEIGHIAPEERRNYPIYSEQMVGYREPTAESAIALMRALSEREASRRPLPDPLPAEPSVPYEYLLKLGSSVRSRADLSRVDQQMILAQLRVALTEERSESVRSSIRALLRALRDRPDATYTVVVEVDGILAGTSEADETAPVREPDSVPGLSSRSDEAPEPGRAEAESELTPEPEHDSRSDLPTASSSGDAEAANVSTADAAPPPGEDDPGGETSEDARHAPADDGETELPVKLIRSAFLVSGVVALATGLPVFWLLLTPDSGDDVVTRWLGALLTAYWMGTGLVFVGLGVAGKMLRRAKRVTFAILGAMFAVCGLAFSAGFANPDQTVEAWTLVMVFASATWGAAGVISSWAFRGAIGPVTLRFVGAAWLGSAALLLVGWFVSFAAFSGFNLFGIILPLALILPGVVLLTVAFGLRDARRLPARIAEQP